MSVHSDNTRMMSKRGKYNNFTLRALDVGLMTSLSRFDVLRVLIEYTHTAILNLFVSCITFFPPFFGSWRHSCVRAKIPYFSSRRIKTRGLHRPLYNSKYYKQSAVKLFTFRLLTTSLLLWPYTCTPPNSLSLLYRTQNAMFCVELQ